MSTSPIRRTGAALVLAVAAALLAACGGGTDACGSDNQSFGVEFSDKPYNLKLGQASNVNSTVTPESCRGDITFSVRNGSLPAGMSLIHGHVTGTPTATGTYRFQVYIDAVDGYHPVIAMSAPRSGLVTVVVAP